MTTHRVNPAYRRAPRLERERDEQGRPANARPRDRYGRPLPRGARDELSERADPAEECASLAEAFDGAVALFDAERFFEAHEFFEHIWKSDELPAGDRAFWKGVTQVAVGCCHVQRGNDGGARTLLGRAIEHLEGYPEPYQGVRTRRLAELAGEVIAHVERHGASPAAPFGRFPRA